MTKLYLSIDTSNSFSSKPKPPNINFADINTNLVNGWSEYTHDSLANLITNGHSFSCGQFEESRKARHWQGQQLFAVDVDTFDAPKPAEAIAYVHKTFNCEPTLVYNSFSSNDTNNKYRLVIAASSVITDGPTCLNILRGLTKELKADAACVDLARLLYGTTPDKLILSTDNTINTEVLVKYGERFKSKHKLALSQVSTNAKTSFNELTPTEATKLKNFLRIQTSYLLNDTKSRYERLKLYGVKLASLKILTPELATDLSQQFFSSNVELKKLYIEDYDKDYLEIITNLFNWRYDS